MIISSLSLSLLLMLRLLCFPMLVVFGVAAVKLAHNVAQSLQLASVYKGEAEKILLVKKSEAEAKIPFW